MTNIKAGDVSNIYTNSILIFIRNIDFIRNKHNAHVQLTKMKSLTDKGFLFIYNKYSFSHLYQLSNHEVMYDSNRASRR